MMRRTTKVLLFTAGAWLATVSRVELASASPTFPGEIKRHIGAVVTPPCSVCHDGNPGVGTATSPFAISMKGRGLVANDTGALDNALDALDGEMTDSDGDGVPDVEELRRGWDPNLPNLADGGVSPNAVRPTTLNTWYGCAVGARAGCSGGAALFFALVAVLAAMRHARTTERRVKVRGRAGE